MDPHEKILEGVRPEVAFGFSTIHIFRSAEIGSAQIGYAGDPAGNSLAGNKGGDWQKNWIAIGYEGTCGDPIFIDKALAGFPVFTAMHGQGRWDAKQIATSLEGFGRALSIVAELSKGRETPSALENNPLSQADRVAALVAIARENPGGDMEFWEILFS